MRRRDVYEHGFDESTGKETPANDCPECNGTLRTDGGETCCSECGLILDEYRFDHTGPRVFRDDERTRRRTGAPLTTTRHDRGLSTEIGYNRDGNGDTLSADKRRQLARLRREHSRAKHQSKAERNLSYGCTEIARIVAAVDLPSNVREQASSLFRTAQKEELLHGRSIEAFAAACVYAACRCNGLTRTLAEIVEVARVDRSRVTNAYSVLNRDLELPVPPRRPREFIPSHASAVDLPQRTVQLATRIAERAHEAGLSQGYNPSGFAAACLELAAARQDVPVQQLALAKAADVCPATVRSQRDLLASHVSGWSL